MSGRSARNPRTWYRNCAALATRADGSEGQCGATRRADGSCPAASNHVVVRVGATAPEGKASR